MRIRKIIRVFNRLTMCLQIQKKLFKQNHIPCLEKLDDQEKHFPPSENINYKPMFKPMDIKINFRSILSSRNAPNILLIIKLKYIYFYLILILKLL